VLVEDSQMLLIQRMKEDKGKSNLSLCLIKYHNMKTYLLLSYAPRHEDVLGSGGIAPRIF
jgi:hypothetical protein